MKVLNLTKGFAPIHCEKEDIIPFVSSFFPGGEPHIALDMECLNDYYGGITITSRVRNASEFLMLLAAFDAISQSGKAEFIHLFVPYFPGARQDRREYGGALTVSIYATVLKEIADYHNIEIFDAHSDVTPALLEPCTNISNYPFVLHALGIFIEYSKKYHIISPDAGSNKKINKLLPQINKATDGLFDSLIKCDKVRDTITGKLSGFEVFCEDLQGRDCIIIDDICDGGGTFIGLAEELKKKNAGDLYLIVSHGIFSKGFKELSKYFKAIYTTDSWRSNIAMESPEIERRSEIVTILPLYLFT